MLREKRFRGNFVDRVLILGCEAEGVRGEVIVGIVDLGIIG